MTLVEPLLLGSFAQAWQKYFGEVSCAKARLEVKKVAARIVTIAMTNSFLTTLYIFFLPKIIMRFANLFVMISQLLNNFKMGHIDCHLKLKAGLVFS